MAITSNRAEQENNEFATGAITRWFLVLVVMATVTALTQTQSPAAADASPQPQAASFVGSIGELAQLEGLASRAAARAAQPEMQRVRGGVSYEVVVGPDRPDVYFTFDDGPDHRGVTDRVLDLLDAYDAKATFFVVGRAAEAFPEQIDRIVNEGHSLGNHSYSHPRLTSLSLADVRRELTRASDVLETLSGHEISCYRPPEAKVNDQIHAIAVELGIGNETWTAEWGSHWGLWDVDSWDWRGGRDRTLDALDTVVEGDVVLMHSLSDFSADIFDEWMSDNHDRFDFEVLPGCMTKPVR